MKGIQIEEFVLVNFNFVFNNYWFNLQGSFPRFKIRDADSFVLFG